MTERPPRPAEQLRSRRDRSTWGQARRPGLRSWHGRRAGFTLVEMLVATALSGMLLAALWMLMSTYGELFDKGQVQVERAQLSRAIMEQIADDLRSAIQDPLPSQANETAGAAQRRRFGLFGSSRELRLDVLQLTPQLGNPIPVGQAAAGQDAPAAPRVPELRTVHYTFFEATTPDEALSPADAQEPVAPQERAGPQGLVRRELDFETPLEDAATAGSTVAESTEAAGLADLDAGVWDEQTEGAAEAPFDDTQLVVPEVVSVQFRYFDGRGWTDAWNSLERKALPAAVAVELQLAERPAAKPRRGAGGEAMPADEQGLPAEAEDAMGLADGIGQEPAAMPQRLITSRLVVDLPGSPNYRPPAVEPQPAASPPARVPVRRTAPPRGTRPAAPAALPEDWLRTGKQ